MEHHFDIEHAENYGIEEAILINHFIFWLTKNKANHKAIKEIEIEIDKKTQKAKRVFTYNSVSAMQEIFPYMNDKKIYRVIESLIEQKVIVRKYFNTNSYNRTSWYCFYNESHFLKTGNGKDKKEKSIPQKQEMDLPETGNHYKDNNKDNNKDIPSTLTLSEQLKELAIKNDLTYSENPDEQGLFHNKLMRLNKSNDRILEQANRFFEIVKRDPKLNWIHAYSFGFKFLQFNWDKIEAWHNANKSQVVQFKKPENEKPKGKPSFSANDLDSLKEFLA